MEDPADLIKFIVEELGKEPFKYDFNVASFGSLNPNALLRIFHTILCDIDAKYKEETQNDTTRVDIPKIIDILRILRYWPKNNVPDDIREALEVPVPETIWEIIAWLLLKKDELKQRSYLAQYLVKIPIPEDILADDDIGDCFEEYEVKMDLFKDTHKKLCDIKRQMEKRPVNELINDLGRIGHDVDCLTRKVDCLKNRFGDVPQKQEYLAQAKLIRKARETKLLQAQQIAQEESKVQNIHKKLELLHLQLTDLSMATECETPEAILKRSEQDVEIYKHIVEQKLPVQIQRAKRAYLAMKITEENPPLCRSDLELRRARLEEVGNDIALCEKSLVPKYQDATVNFAREQAHMNQKLKANHNKELEAMKQDLKALENTLEGKRQEQKSLFGEDFVVPNTQGYRDYVNKVRAKAAAYKTSRAELQQFQAEVGNLSVTKYILDGDLRDSDGRVQEIENQLGIVGFTTMREQMENLSMEKSSTELKKLEGINDMADLAKILNEQVMAKKYDLEPLMSDLSLARKGDCQLDSEREEAKVKMDMELAPITSEFCQLEKKVHQFKEKFEKDMLQFTKMSAEIPVMKTTLHVANDASNNGQCHFVRSNLDRVRAKVLESERVHQELQTEIDQLDDVQEYEENQKKMWTDLSQMLQIKLSGMKSPVSSNVTTECDSGRNYEFDSPRDDSQ